MGEGEKVCGVCVCVHVGVCALLTTILMIVASPKQKSPGTQQRTVAISVVVMLVRKAYLGRLVVFPVNVCCVMRMGTLGCS